VSGRAVIIVQSSALVIRPNCVRLVLHEVELSIRRQRLPEDVVAALASTVQAGIRQAQDRLTMDRAPRIFKPADLVRNIPVVGKMWGWFAPKQNDLKENVQSFTINKPNTPSSNNSRDANGVKAGTAATK